MINNRLCSLLGINYPIIQGGMVWVSDWHLASACSKAGILGTLGTGSMTHDQVKSNIDKMNELGAQPFAVNIAMLRDDADEIGKIALERGVKIFITSAGNPANIIPLLKKEGTICIHVVPSIRGAVKAEQAGADAIVCEGYEAGGHNSPYETTTMALVPQVVDAVRVPVVAAGGIADGRGIAAAMALGADGVQMGTRFIATKECNSNDNHKKIIVDAPDTGTCILGRNLNMLRVVRNKFADEMLAAEKEGADKEALLKIIGDEFNRNRAASVEGDMDKGTFQAGQSSGLVKDIVPVEQLIQRLLAEYKETVEELRARS